MTSAMNRSGMGYAKVGREQQERQERHKADRGKKTKGTKAGHSGSVYPKRSHTMDTMYPHKKTARLKAKAASMKSEAYTVTNADKKGNTPAYQGYKAGKKNAVTGKPMYKAADHMKEGMIGKVVGGVENVAGKALKTGAKVAGGAVKKTLATTGRGAMGAVSGAAKGISKGLSEEQYRSNFRKKLNNIK